MSHWTKIKTKLTNLDLIKKALDRMGINFEEGQHTIKQYGKSEKAELRLDAAVGLSVQEDGTYAMVGDFWHANRNSKLRSYYGNSKKFTADLGTAYAIEEAKESLEVQGFFCTENSDAEVGEDGLIRMTFESF